ncbi:DUF1707 domain-containing protein [Nocardia cyriacigeorgica]|uniref:DUF1707 domain-containing protein n=1 Tax=Nocardia cyriacigeorgica TaxID=135487 RepID=A0A6P1D4L5_9NOCA|nr:DUF1707 domain-containing protein [Nocardia cyriacigeorgica]NEW39192.1 DUF1707 domain-containing protein [Nocardia cyriacigeorgica]NEW43122.1 DUF1707 domain-containing protein [Nocardia cyriacigeorgica]NEW49696.1 DUF1707 domain-containing protein [Nocardia cyriacigeorgica]NEW56023.1 DUF1707 domain-containing protein [Nocardia cyriacigeorgica]
MEISPGTRASDAERAQIVELLSRHLADGRLDLAEYDQRVAQVYATTTRDDLGLVLSDLPKPAEVRPEKTVRSRAARIPIWQRIEAASWVSVSVLVLIIWGTISLAAGEFTYPWPVWVIGPWGAVLAFRAITGFESGRLCRSA